METNGGGFVAEWTPTLDPCPDAKALFEEETVLVNLRFAVLGETRESAIDGEGIRISDEVKAKKRISARQKILECKELKKIRGLKVAIRKYVASLALPTTVLRGGMVLVPRTLLGALDARLTDFSAKWSEAVVDFVLHYPERKEEAREALGPLFREAHYPDAHLVRHEFSFTYQYQTLGVAKGLNEEMANRERLKAEALWQEAALEVTAGLRTGFAELIKHMVDRLSPGDDGKPKIFHESFVNKLREFLDTFKNRDLLNDVELAWLVERARAVMNGATVEMLRTDEQYRSTVHQQFEAIEIAATKAADIARRKISFKENEE